MHVAAGVPGDPKIGQNYVFLAENSSLVTEIVKNAFVPFLLFEYQGVFINGHL
jgi:hypothetical protein